MSATADIRLLITDTETPHIFSDPQIESFLRLEENDTRRAAALALETIATNEALVLKRITLKDLSTDGPATAKALMERAAALRDQADEEEGGFDYHYPNPDNFPEQGI